MHCASVDLSKEKLRLRRRQVCIAGEAETERDPGMSETVPCATARRHQACHYYSVEATK